MHGLLQAWGLPVPEIVEQDGARGILVLEDLGDRTLQEVLKDAPAAQRERLYREALDDLALLQREAAHGPQRAPCFQIAFDIEKLSWELHYFLKHFVEGYRGRRPHGGGPGHRSPRASTGSPRRSRPGPVCSATATSTAAT